DGEAQTHGALDLLLAGQGGIALGPLDLSPDLRQNFGSAARRASGPRPSDAGGRLRPAPRAGRLASTPALRGGRRFRGTGAGRQQGGKLFFGKKAFRFRRRFLGCRGGWRRFLHLGHFPSSLASTDLAQIDEKDAHMLSFAQEALAQASSQEIKTQEKKGVEQKGEGDKERKI